MMARHLCAAGYRRIGFIGGDGADTRGADRRRGFLAALGDAGRPTDRLVIDGAPPVSMAEGAAAMEALLTRWPDTEAVMCVSDLSAFGALGAARRMGRPAPSGVAVAGFGAYDLSEHAHPALTTIDAKATEIGARTADLVLSALARDDAAATREVIRIAPDLIPRASTARP